MSEERMEPTRYYLGELRPGSIAILPDGELLVTTKYAQDGKTQCILLDGGDEVFRANDEPVHEVRIIIPPAPVPSRSLPG